MTSVLIVLAYPERLRRRYYANMTAAFPEVTIRAGMNITCHPTFVSKGIFTTICWPSISRKAPVSPTMWP